MKLLSIHVIEHYHCYYNNLTGVEESSLNENSNPKPLTNRACVQTTEILIPDNIQDMPLEGSQVGMLRAHDCRNLICKK